jgi:hypothetical protein
METYIKKPSLKSFANRLLRKAQRAEVTKLQTNTVTIRNVYKNKQIIEVACSGLNRCFSKI